jgi:ornithine cyclodeaminase/alanine dehydrogenase
MTEILLLTREEVGSLISLPEVIAAVEDAYTAYIKGQTTIPPVVNLQVDHHDGEVDIKSAYVQPPELIGIKVASGFWENQEKFGLPSGFATILLLHGVTGVPLCVMDGGYITATRTGAAGAVAAKYLARPDAEEVAIIGAGTQGRLQLRALLEVRGIKGVRVYDTVSEWARSYVEEMSHELPELAFSAVSDVREAVQGADIVVTATPSTHPLVQAGWISPGVHINAVGADAPGKQELDPHIFIGAKVVVDKLSQCRLIGETQHPLSLGLIAEEDIHAEIGEITAGMKPGRENDEEVTLFDTTGVAIQDVAAASRVYKRAKERGIGTVFPLFR